MIDSKEKLKIFEPVVWMSDGTMLLLDCEHRYWYSRVYHQRQYDFVKKMCRMRHKGKVYQYLKTHCKYEYKERACTSN